MSTKYGSVYFATEKDQTEGPQARSFARADDESNTFFVAYMAGISKKGRPFYEHASYKDLPTFLHEYSKIPDDDRFFGELIRDGHACSEYYDVDIDWGLKSCPTDMELGDIKQMEQQVFIEFLTARNKFAPQYPVTADQCRILSASSLISEKVSLHIVIPTYTFKNNNEQMRAFMIDFERARSAQDKDQGQSGNLCGYIDMGVYSRNRNI